MSTRAPPSNLSRALALGVMVLCVPLSLWLIPEPEAPKATQAPLLPPPSVQATPLVVDAHPEEAIRSALDAYYNALNAHDAKTVASLWAAMEDVVVDLPGQESVRGPQAVAALYSKMLAAGGLGHVEYARVRMRVLGGRAEVALLETISEGSKNPERKHVHVATHVLFKTDAGWRWVAHRRLPELDAINPPDAGR